MAVLNVSSGQCVNSTVDCSKGIFPEAAEYLSNCVVASAADVQLRGDDGVLVSGVLPLLPFASRLKLRPTADFLLFRLFATIFLSLGVLLGI